MKKMYARVVTILRDEHMKAIYLNCYTGSSTTENTAIATVRSKMYEKYVNPFLLFDS